MRAVENVTRILESFLMGRYDLEIIDIYQQPQLAYDDSVIATPTLLKLSPLPLKRIVGDMSDPSLVLDQLDIHV
jgi:circadian clock protein KaiB